MSSTDETYPASGATALMLFFRRAYALLLTTDRYPPFRLSA